MSPKFTGEIIHAVESLDIVLLFRYYVSVSLIFFFFFSFRSKNGTIQHKCIRNINKTRILFVHFSIRHPVYEYIIVTMFRHEFNFTLAVLY